MRPIESPMSKEALDLLQKAQKLLDRVEKKAKDCPECEGKGDDCKCDEKCPTCGEKMDKMGCIKMGCGGKMDVEKSEAGSQPGFETSFDSNPGGVMFMAESGGQTRSAYYTTNQYLYGGEDVANKGTTSQSFSLESLSGKLNPHAGSGVERLTSGGNGPSLQ